LIFNQIPMKKQPKQSCDDVESMKLNHLIISELEDILATANDFKSQLMLLKNKVAIFFKNSTFLVLFIDKKHQLLHNDFFGLRNEDQPRYEISLNEINSIEIWCIQHAENIFSNNFAIDIKGNDLFAELHHLSTEAASIMCIPLIFQGTTIGIACVKNNEANAFTTCEFELFIHITFMVSILSSLCFKEESSKLIEDELVASRKQLLESEKMASLGQLSAGIAHEIKNPLNFINNFAMLSVDLSAELSEEFDKLSSEMNQNDKEYLAEIIQDLQSNMLKIKEHGQRAESIIKGMLLHSRGKSGEFIPTDINALLAEYVNLGYHGMRAQDVSFNIKIESAYDQTIGRIQVVPQNLSRVFLNIINNACYATNEKKTKLKDAYFPTLSVQTKNSENEIEIRIRDNGPGIPQGVIDKVFNPFFTTKPPGQGTGLGLSLSYEIIVKEHHGQMQVESQEGEYAEFVIKIPKNLT